MLTTTATTNTDAAAAAAAATTTTTTTAAAAATTTTAAAAAAAAATTTTTTAAAAAAAAATTTTTTTTTATTTIINESSFTERLKSGFLTVSSLRHELSPTRMLKWPGQSCAVTCKSYATHRALIACNMPCASYYEGTAQLLRLTEFKLHLF